MTDYPSLAGDKPYRIGTKQVTVWVIPVSYVTNVQLIEVRVA